MKAIVEARYPNHTSLAPGRNHLPRLFGTGGNRLLQVHVLAATESLAGQLGVQGTRGGDDHGVYFHVFEHFVLTLEDGAAGRDAACSFQSFPPRIRERD